MADTTHGWIAAEVDEEVPSAARVYDFLLGGGHNFRADRALAEDLLTVLPAQDMARLNREYLGRVVRVLSDQGITQFLDLGSGIPTVGNVHEIAQRLNPAARVVYVDNDPIAVAHAELLLRDNENTASIMVDIRNPERIAEHPDVCRLLDFTKPLGLLMVGVIQFIPDDDDPWSMAKTYRGMLASGSYLALSAFTWDNTPEGMRGAITVFQNSRDPLFPRSRADLLRMFGDFELVEPGVTYTADWRPDRPGKPTDSVSSNMYAGVGLKS